MASGRAPNDLGRSVPGLLGSPKLLVLQMRRHHLQIEEMCLHQLELKYYNGVKIHKFHVMIFMLILFNFIAL
jgi:hypothetical protein